MPIVKDPVTTTPYHITHEERRALAHLVPDPDAWIAHAMANLPDPEPAIQAKIKKALDLYATIPDAEYTTRAERDTAELAALLPTPQQAALDRELALAQLHANLAAAAKHKLTQAQAHLHAQIDTLTQAPKP